MYLGTMTMRSFPTAVELAARRRVSSARALKVLETVEEARRRSKRRGHAPEMFVARTLSAQGSALKN